MKNDILFTEISESLQKNISETAVTRIGLLNEFIERFQGRFADLMGDQPEKPAEFWSSLAEILNQLHQRLSDSFELESLMGSGPLLKQWRDPYDSLLDKSDTVILQPYDDAFWRLKSSKSYIHKFKKVFCYFIHPIFFLRSRGRLPAGGKQPERTFNPRLFNEVYVLHPLIDFQWHELHHLLLFYSRLLIRLQSATDKLKDTVLRTAELASNDVYWSSLQSQSREKSLDSISKAINEVRVSIAQYKEDAERRLELFQDSLKEQYAQKWRFAGTPLLTRSAFSERKGVHLRVKMERRLSLFREGWINHLESVKDEWQKDIELGILQLKIAILHNETGQLIGQKSEGKILPALDKVGTKLKAARQELETLRSTDGNEFHEKLLHFNRNLQRGLRQKELADAVETLTNAHLSRTFRGFVARVADLVENLAERHVIIKEYNLDKFPPKTTIDEIMLKEIVREEIVLRSEQANEEQIAQLVVNLDSITRTVSTIDQVIEFNFSAAMDLIRQSDGTVQHAPALQIAAEGIDRTLGLLDDAQQRYRETISEGLARIDNLALNLEKGVQELGDNERIIQLKLRLARARTLENLRKWRHDTWQAIIRFVPNLLRILRTYIGQFSKGYRKVRKISGLGPAAGDEKADIFRYLTYEEQKIAGLPFIYQRLFQMLPLEDERFFFGRSLEMDKIKEHFANFKNGQIMITAVIGEKGGGKTTLLNFARKSIFKGYPVSRVAAPCTIWTIPEFCNLMKTELQLECNDSPGDIEQILANGPKRILILEDIHNLFLRTIDGFSVVEALLNLIAATQQKIYWIVTSGLYGWKFLDYVLHISDLFTDIIELDNLDSVEVEQLMMSRHNMSGFFLEFSASDEQAETRPYKKLKSDSERQEYLRRRFFDHLSEVSGGNIKTSMIYWISSVVFTKSDEPMQVIDNIDLDPSFTYHISAEDSYYLAAYIQHEFLTMQEFALVFGIELSQARFIIDRLTRRGYLKPINENYYIPPIMYRPIVRMLKVKNIIY